MLGKRNERLVTTLNICYWGTANQTTCDSVQLGIMMNTNDNIQNAKKRMKRMEEEVGTILLIV